MHWEEFKQQAPQLAAKGEDRFDRTGLVLLGSLRRNGFPRISPVEPLIAHGKLYLSRLELNKERKKIDPNKPPVRVIYPNNPPLAL